MKGQGQIANDKAQESTLIARLPRFREWPIRDVDPSGILPLYRDYPKRTTETTTGVRALTLQASDVNLSISALH